MIRNLAINEILHLPLKELEARLRSGDYYIDHRGMGRKDRRIIKKGAPEYGICRWDLVKRKEQLLDSQGYIFNAYKWSKGGDYMRVCCLVFTSTFDITFVAAEGVYDEDRVGKAWDRYEINKDWSISDYFEDTK